MHLRRNRALYLETSQMKTTPRNAKWKPVKRWQNINGSYVVWYDSEKAARWAQKYVLSCGYPGYAIVANPVLVLPLTAESYEAMRRKIAKAFSGSYDGFLHKDDITKMLRSLGIRPTSPKPTARKK